MENVEKDTLTSRPCGLCKKTIWEGDGFLGVDPETICKCGVEHRSNVEAMVQAATRHGYEEGLEDADGIICEEMDKTRRVNVSDADFLQWRTETGKAILSRLHALKSSKV